MRISKHISFIIGLFWIISSYSVFAQITPLSSVTFCEGDSVILTTPAISNGIYTWTKTLDSTIYFEDFSSYGWGAVQGYGNPPSWTINTNYAGGGDFFTDGGNSRFRAYNYTGYFLWETKYIDISTFNDIKLSAKFITYNGFTANSYYQIFYKLNEDTFKLYEDNGFAYGLITTDSIARQDSLNGDSIKLRIKIYHEAQGIYYHFFTNISIKGEPKVYSQDTFIIAKDESDYYVTVIDTIVKDTTINSVYVTVNNNPIVDLGADTIVCSSYGLNVEDTLSSYLWSTGDTTQSITAYGSQLYKVTALNIFGCQTKDSVSLQIKSPSNAILINISDSVICGGDTITLSVQNDSSATYLWKEDRLSVIDTVWYEDFSLYNLNETIGIGNPPKWTTAKNSQCCGSYFKVVLNHYKARYLQGTGTWTSEYIDISDYSEVYISCRIWQGGTIGDPYYSRAYYRLNNDTATPFEIHPYREGATGPDMPLARGITGDSVQIILEFEQSVRFSDNGFAQWFDDIVVFGKKSKVQSSTNEIKIIASIPETYNVTIIDSNTGCQNSFLFNIDASPIPSTNLVDEIPISCDSSVLLNAVGQYYDSRVLISEVAQCVECSSLAGLQADSIWPLPLQSNHNGAYLELTNYGNYPIDISAYFLEAKTNFPHNGDNTTYNVFPKNTVIAPHDVLLIAFNATQNFPQYNVINFEGLNLMDVCEGFILYDNHANILDAVAINGYFSFSPELWSGSVLNIYTGNISAMRVGSQDNNSSSDWIKSTTANPSSLGAINKGIVFADPLIYSWSPAMGLSRNDTSSILASPIIDTKYYLTTSTPNGNCVFSDSISIIIDTTRLPINLNIIPSDSILCLGDSVIANTSGYLNYIWSTNDTIDSIVIYNSGNYWLTANNNCGFNVYSDTIQIQIDSILYTNIIADGPLAFCLGDNVKLTTNDSLNSIWSMGDTTISKIILSSGNYWYSRSEIKGCLILSDTVVVSVDNTIPLVSSIVGDTVLNCIFDSINLQSFVTSENIRWRLNGSLISGANSSNLWAKTIGNYSIETYNGCFSSLSDSKSILMDNSMSAFFTFSPSEVDLANFSPVTFFHSDPIAKYWDWDFGDGDYSSIQNPIHNYTRVDSYNVKLTVKNSNQNCSSEYNNSIIISDSELEPNCPIVKTGSLNQTRFYHQTIELNNEKVLTIGGAYAEAPTLIGATCELYDPATEVWTYTDNLNIARSNFTAAKLNNGNIIVMGGYNTPSVSISSCEIYDVSTGLWSLVSSMNEARSNFKSFLLPSGKILVIGGGGGSSESSKKSCEIYDPISDTWTYIDSMNIGRSFYGATWLSDSNTILVVGGSLGSNSAEIYNITTATWNLLTDTLKYEYYYSTYRWIGATMLYSGEVLITGDYEHAELYNPLNKTFKKINSSNQIKDGYGVRISNSRVLYYQIGDPFVVNTEAIDIFKSQTYKWTAYSPDVQDHNTCGQVGATTTLLSNGKVLLVGGTRTPNLLYPETYLVACFANTSVQNNNLKKSNNDILLNTYPNPFNNSINITYYLGKNSNVEVSVSNLLGQDIETIANENQSIGNHNYTFSPNQSGIYILKVRANDEVYTKRIVKID